jgi:hypothetical protein
MSRKLSASFLPHHASQVSFTPDQRERMLQWVGEVKNFLDINEAVLRRIDFSGPAAVGASTEQFFKWNGYEWMSSFMQSLDHFEGQANKTKCEEYMGDAQLLAQCSATLISLICHISNNIVQRALSLLEKVPTVLQEVKMDLENQDAAFGGARRKGDTFAIDACLSSENQRYSSIIKQLFQFWGPNIEPLVVVLVTSLEPYYFHPRIEVQYLSIIAVSCAIVECSKTFAENHGISVVWNLYFLLESFADDTSGLISPNRPCEAICNALSSLAPLYVVSERTLTFQIMTKMLCLGNKTMGEESSILSCMKNIFRLFAEIDDNSKRYSMLPMFLGLLSAHHEQNYDLVHSALMAYYLISFHKREQFCDPAAKSMYDKVCGIVNHEVQRQPNCVDLQRQREKKYTANLALLMTNNREVIKCPPIVSVFADSVLQHFQAASELVKFGAALYLHASLLIYGEHIWTNSVSIPGLTVPNKLAEIAFHVISGCFDKAWYVSSLCLDILELLILLTDDVVLLSEIRAHRQFYANATCPAQRSNLSKIIDAFIGKPAIPSFASREVSSLIGGLQFMEFGEQTRQLNIVSCIASNVSEVDSTVLHNLFPYLLFGRDGFMVGGKQLWRLQDNTSEVVQNKRSLQVQTLKIFQKLERSIKKAPVDLLNMLDTYLNQIIEQQVTEITKSEAQDRADSSVTGSSFSIVMLSIDIISKMPYNELRNSKFESILVSFKRGLVFSKSAELRLSSLETIRTMRNTWESSSVYLRTVLSMLLLCLGDVHAPCRHLAAEIILDRKDSLPFGLVKLLKDGPSMYHEINPKIPLRAYKKIAEELHRVQLSSADNMHPDLCGAIAELVSEKFVSSLPHHIIPLINEIGETEKDVDAEPFTSTYSSRT